MNDLFWKDLKIIRLEKNDALLITDKLNDLKNIVLENEEMYPGIDKWFENKVIPGLKSDERIGLVGYENEIPVVSAVVRKGKDSKFCHLRIKDGLQDENLGDVFFSLMALEVRHIAKEIHFTLPESLWESKKGFFNSFNFKYIGEANNQYRKGIKELKCSANSINVWKAVLKKLPKIARIFSISGYSLENSLLLSLKPNLAKKIINGEKRIEIRRKFSKKWINRKVNFFSTYPNSALVGEAIIYKIIEDTPDNIWREFSSEIACDKNEFNKYVGKNKKVFALFLDEIYPYRAPIYLSQISHLIDKNLKPPQSYYSLNNNDDWAEAVSLATLLQGSLCYSNAITLEKTI